MKLYASCVSPRRWIGAPIPGAVDIGKLIEVHRTAFAALPDAGLYGLIAKAGLPKGYQPLSHAA